MSFFEEFINALRNTTPLEYIAVFAGIASVYFSRIENILVYPVGLINTIIYVYISINYDLWGEASVNFYYTVMSFYGWYMWMRKDRDQRPVLHVTYASRKEWNIHLLFFIVCYGILFASLTVLKNEFFEGAIPWADGFAAATAFTGMWLMTKKKVESWYWWIATNIASIPLFYVKGLALTSVYYFILLIMAFFGLAEWKKRAQPNGNA